MRPIQDPICIATLRHPRLRRTWAVKPLARALAAAGLLASPLWLQAAPPAANTLPTGLQVTAGQATLRSQGSQMTVRNSNGAILNWGSFNIGSAAGVYFDQPNAASKVLNRVSGNDPTQIFGSLASNGQVWLLNPNGVLFGQGARVDVAGLVTSTLRLNDSDFLNGRYRFGGDAGSTALVRNEGRIRSTNGGQVVLLGARVENAGSVEAPGGHITLASGRGVDLIDTGLPNLAVRVDVPEGEVLNVGRLMADSGAVDVFGAIVNQQGLIQVDTMAVDGNGHILLRASDTLTLGAGSVTQARGAASGSSGGSVDLLGAQVALTGAAAVDVSGLASGGGIRVGGGMQGRDSSVTNARAVWIGPGVTLRADATGDSGRGGRIVVWSDEATRVYGTLSARGGRFAGDGGFVETSGGWLDARPAEVDVSSRAGQAGQWLLDPNDIAITSTGSDTSITGSPSFTSTGDSSVISTATIAAALNAGSNVSISTGTGGANSQAGDILMDGATLSVSPTQAVTFRLSAARDVVVRNSSIGSAASPLALDFVSAGSGVGGIDISGSNLLTAGGNITLGGASAVQLPLPGGTLSTATYQAAIGRVGRPTAISVTGSTLNLGTGSFSAIGVTSLDNGDGVVIGGSSGATLALNAGNVNIVGASGSTNSTTSFHVGVNISGQDTGLSASQGLQLEGYGRTGVRLSDGARVQLIAAANSGAQASITGGGIDFGGVAFLAHDATNNLPGRGSRLTVVNASLAVAGTGTAGTGIGFYNNAGAPGPLLALSGATSASFTVPASVINGGFPNAFNIINVELELPAAGASSFVGDLGLFMGQSVVSGGGSLTFTAQGITLSNSLISSSGAPLALNFATAGPDPGGVSLSNTIISTGNGDLTFGASSVVCTTVLGCSTTAAPWLRNNNGSFVQAGLELLGSNIDAGSGRIVGGGVSEVVAGLSASDSILSARSIDLAGRSDVGEGLVVSGTTLKADRLLRLDGLSAAAGTGVGAGLSVLQASTLQLADTTTSTGSQLALTGKNIGGHAGVRIEGGDAGTVNETRVIVSGGSLDVRGDATLAGAYGVQLTGTAAVPGGLLINALGATSTTLDGRSSGAGLGLSIQHVNVLGPQGTAGAQLLLRGSGRNVDGTPGTVIDDSTITTGGTLTVQGDGMAISASDLSGEAGLSLLSNTGAGAPAAGPVFLSGSALTATAPGAVLRIQGTAGDAVRGDAAYQSGAGVTLTNSALTASGAGGGIFVQGQGAVAGGTGITFTQTPFSADTITMTGAGIVNGHGIFSEDLTNGQDSTLTAINLTLTGRSANDPQVNDKVGVRLGNGASVVLSGRGTATIQGDTVVLGSSGGGGTKPFAASGDAAEFNVRSDESQLTANASLDFRGGSGTNVSFVGDADGNQSGRVRLGRNNAVSIHTGGGSFTASGIGDASATSGGSVVPNTLLRPGAIGVFFGGNTTVDAGAGAITLTGTGGTSNGISGIGSPGGFVATLSGGTVTMSGTGSGGGFGIDFGYSDELNASATVGRLVLNATSATLTGQTSGIDGTTNLPSPAIGIAGGSSITVSSGPLVLKTTSQGAWLKNTSLSAASATIDSAGPLTLTNTTLNTTGAVSLTATGDPANGMLLSLASSAITASGIVQIGGTATTAGQGVSLLAGTAVTGANVTLSGTGVGAAGVAFSDSIGSNSISATTGTMTLTGRSDTAPGVSFNGGWTLNSPTLINIDSSSALQQLGGTTSGLGQTFNALQAVNLTLQSPAALQGLDTALFSSAVAGMSTSTTVSVTAVGTGLTLGSSLAVPGRLVLQADSLTLQPETVLSGGGAGDAVVLRGSTGGSITSFSNSAGASALAAPNGRWLILAADPRTTSLGGLQADFTAYNLSAQPWTVDVLGNYVTPATGNAVGYDISTATLNGAVLSGVLSKVYDAGTGISLNPTTWTLTGLNSGDTLVFSGSSLAALADKNVGTGLPVTIAASTVFSFTDSGGRPVFGYSAPSFTANVTPLSVPLTGTTVANKVYDGGISASFGSLGIVTPLAGDSLTVGGAPLASFGDRNVGTGKAVAISGFALAGADAGNYTLVAPTTLTADITARALAIGGLSAQSRVYDGTTSAPLAGTAAISALAGDAVALAGSANASFADKNVGSAKPVTVTGFSLTGADAGNYALLQPTGLNAAITPLSVTLAGLTAQSRVYDGSTSASFAGTATVTPLAGDVLALAGAAQGRFGDKTVGSAKPVTLTGLSLSGTDAGNYVLATPAYAASITPLAVALTGTTVASKVYDGGTSASFGTLGTVTPLAGDSLGVGGSTTATFGDRNVGTGKAVAIGGFALTGADAGNYTLVAPTSLTADITARPLAVSGLTAQSRVYDSTTGAPLTGTAGISALPGDAVTLAGTANASFADKNAGLAKAVTVSGFSLTGADAGNYALAQPAGLSADISPLSLALAGLTAQSRVYDGSTSASFLGTASVTPLAGDVLALAGAAQGRFGDKAVGSAKPVTLSGLSLSGRDAGNYALAIPAYAADITPAPLVLLNVAAASKTYDSTRSAAISGALSGAVPGDTLSLSLTGQFDDANVGAARNVAWSASVAGADAVNYLLAATGGTVQGAITPATLTYVATPVLGTSTQPLPLLTGSVTGFAGTDSLAGATTGALTWSTNATSASPAGRYAVTGNGLAALNYIFVQDSRNAAALTLQAPATVDAATAGTNVAVAAALTSVQVPQTMSTPTQGRVLDVTTAFVTPAGAEASVTGGASPGAGNAAGGGTAGGEAAAQLTLAQGRAVALSASGEAADGVTFRAVDVSRLPRDEVQSLLAARARFKQKIFARGVFRLQQDPTLADVRPCRTEAELDSGACIVTEQLKQEIQAARTLRDSASAPHATRARRGVKVAALPVIERKLALVIGINRYDDKRVPELTGSVPDARAVRQSLEERMGYEATLLENPSREQIVRAFNKLALDAEANDSVIVYYAGHGVLVPIDGVDTGYWLPSDVNAEEPASWLSNADIGRMVAAVSSRQVMLVSDSCYSGQLAGKERVVVSGAPEASDLLKRRAAVVMSSGGDEPVADEGREGHSIFAWHFLRALEGLDQWQVGGNLFERVRAGVVKDFPQTPQYGASRTGGHQGNTDYLFERRELESLSR